MYLFVLVLIYFYKKSMIFEKVELDVLRHKYQAINENREERFI